MNSFFTIPKAPECQEKPKQKTYEMKSKWPTRNWPSDALRVVGLHPAIVAYKVGPTFYLKVEFENKELVERCRIQLQERLGVELPPVRNVCFRMENGADQWWTSVTQPVLEEIDMMSWPMSAKDSVGPVGTALSTSEKKARLEKLAADTLTALTEITREQAARAKAGDFVQMDDTPQQAYAKIRGQAILYSEVLQEFTSATKIGSKEQL